MKPEHNKLRSIPSVSLLYIKGLEGLMNRDNMTLEEARELALKDCADMKGEENIPFIEAAYEHLKVKSSE